MSNVSARLVLVIASLLIAITVAGAILGQVNLISVALDERGETASDELASDVTIVDDPGARRSIYDDDTNELTLHVKNTGANTLPANPDAIDLLVDGQYQTDVAVTVLEEGTWRSGTVIRLATAVDIDRNETMRVVVRVNGNEDVLVFDAVGTPEHPREEIVFTVAGALKSVAPDGSIENYGVSAAAIGPKEVDFDGDERLEVPFVRSNGELALVDADGETQVLATGAKATDTLLGVGTWRHGTSVFYVNESDGNYVYRAAPGRQPERVFADGNPIAASAIAGIGDYDDDGDPDLVFANGSANVTYVDEKTKHHVGRAVATGDSIGIGAPRVFDAEPIGLPFVDDGRDVALLSATNAKDTLTTGGPANATPVAGIDWNDDGTREVAFIDAGTGTLQYVRLDGTVVTITDSAGDPVSADPETGVA
jgi:flagellar protein FlaG